MILFKVSDDNKDRGIEFRYHNGSVGFFGFDDSTGKFTFISDVPQTTQVLFSGSVYGDVAFGGIAGTG